MNKISFNPFPVLKTDRLNLRQIKETDLNELFILKSDERLLKKYNGKAKTYEETVLKLRSLVDSMEKKRSITWGISYKDEDKLIGSICLWNICEEQSKAEIGYELMYNFQGQGIMQEAIKAVIDYGFKNMGLHFIEAVLYESNVESVKLLERNSFMLVEDFTEEEIVDEKVMKLVLYKLKNRD